MKAVVTADIVNSTLVKAANFNDLSDKIKAIYEKDKIEFYRGDSFQVLVNDAQKVFLQSILSRLLAMQYSNKQKVDIRMSISLGKLNSNSGKIGSNMDDLFVRSGRAFDKFQNSTRRLYVVSGNESIDFTFEIMAEYMDSLLENITPRQAEVLYYMLKGMSQVEIARQLDKTTATINQHVKTARYTEIESLLKKFVILTQQLQDGR
jgi:DNA-directed RNA polymerase specialized sigma24 family protein